MKALAYGMFKIITVGLLAAATVVALLLWSQTPLPAHANPFYVGTKAKSALATSTLTYMTPGTATTTVVYDSFEVNGTNQTNGGNTTLPDSVAFLIQGAASSTATVVNAACEYGDDETNNASPAITSVDWYQNGILGPTTTNSGLQTVTTVNTFSFTFASTSVGGNPILGTTNRFEKVVVCPVVTRYVRTVVTVTGANAGVWVGIVPKKQRN